MRTTTKIRWCLTQTASSIVEVTPDSDEVVFGFCRRGCPGEGLADANVFIAMAMSLPVFNIEKAKMKVEMRSILK
jgi:hypothetical protein